VCNLADDAVAVTVANTVQLATLLATINVHSPSVKESTGGSKTFCDDNVVLVYKLVCSVHPIAHVAAKDSAPNALVVAKVGQNASMSGDPKMNLGILEHCIQRDDNDDPRCPRRRRCDDNGTQE
jgi:hypothetical protein